MNDFVQATVRHGTGHITLDRPPALNSLTLDMVRTLTTTLSGWAADPRVAAVVVDSSTTRAFCAGGDIRFLHDAGRANPQGGSALLEDFFTEEYSLNHLIHHYPKPYIALMDGVVMGGGMGIAQAGPANRVRIVTERTKMAMPEVNIGLFPDVGGSYFLPRASGKTGLYLALTGLTIGAADALRAGLADLFVPSTRLDALRALIAATAGAQLRAAIEAFAAPLRDAAGPAPLASHASDIARHFGAASVAAIVQSLGEDDHAFAAKARAAMALRSPLMMSATFELLRRGATLGLADCLRLERALVRRVFEHGEVVEGVRALVVDKDNAPRWSPPVLADVTDQMVAGLFEPVWPAHAHPLRGLL